MTRTRDQPKQLRDGIAKVEDLRDQKQDKRLAEVAEDTDHDEYHAREVAVCVSHKGTGRVPVIPEEGEGYS